MGDGRTYENLCALRAVTSLGLTAEFFHFDMKLLRRVANRIVNEVRGINRVVYDATSKTPGHHRVGVTASQLRLRQDEAPAYACGSIEDG